MTLTLDTHRLRGWWRWLPLYVSPLSYGLGSVWNPRYWCGVAFGSFGHVVSVMSE